MRLYDYIDVLECYNDFDLMGIIEHRSFAEFMRTYFTPVYNAELDFIGFEQSNFGE